jgi:hypothetical protein
MPMVINSDIQHINTTLKKTKNFIAKITLRKPESVISFFWNAATGFLW